MTAKLVAEEGVLKELVLSLEGEGQWVIGRDPELCQLITEDPATSREHLVLRMTDGGMLAQNLSDSNPVQVNNITLTDPKILKHGDLLKIGDSIFRFYEEGEAVIVDEETPSQEEGSTESAPTSSESSETDTATETEASPEPVAVALEEEDEPEHDTIYDEDSEDEKKVLAEIDFELMETGRWLLKVVGGPNNGAEFSMQAGNSYLIGTDPNNCDIVFHDTSVSRQHAKISVNEDETLTVEDLKSRNGTLVEGEKLEGSKPLEMNQLVTMGTTSFIVYDREGEMHTVISPLMPSIVKSLQKEEEEEKESDEKVEEEEEILLSEEEVEEKQKTISTTAVLAVIAGVLVLAGFGTSTLFVTTPVQEVLVDNPNEQLRMALEPFPNITPSYNKSTGRLLLVGHVLTGTEKSQLMYNLQGMDFIKVIDDSGIVIDEYVWRETNYVLSRDPRWKGINVHSPQAGSFVLSGYLETRKQFEELSDYITANFPYLDLLEKKIIVEEDVVTGIDVQLENAGIKGIRAQMTNGQLTLRGSVPPTKTSEFDTLLEEFRQIPGVRNVKNFVTQAAKAASVINVSDRYQVTGTTRQGGNVNVVISGRILTVGDKLDGMVINEIQPNAILLEKDSVQYRIDYK